MQSICNTDGQAEGEKGIETQNRCASDEGQNLFWARRGGAALPYSGLRIDQKRGPQHGNVYSKALRILNCAEEELGILLAYRYHGGSSGGKAEITPEGASFLQAYREYNQQIQQFAEQTFERYFAVKQLPPQAKDGE